MHNVYTYIYYVHTCLYGFFRKYYRKASHLDQGLQGMCIALYIALHTELPIFNNSIGRNAAIQYIQGWNENKWYTKWYTVMVFTGHLCSETCTMYSQVYTMYILSTYRYIQIYVCTYNVYTPAYRYIQEYTSSEHVHTRHIHVHRWCIQIFVSLNINFKK